MTTTIDLLVIGSYVQDHVWQTPSFPAPGETRRGTGFGTSHGGKGFNQAIAAHRQGARTVFVAAIGDDPLGRNAQAYAREAGLACHWQICGEQPTAAAGIVVDDDGRNQIVVYLGANESLDPDFLVEPLAVVGPGSWVLLQLESNPDAVRAAVAIGRDRGARIALNPAPVHPVVDAGLLARIDLLTPNENEFSQLLESLTGTRIEPDKVAQLSDDALHAYSRKLGVGTVVITLGAHGCFVSHGSGTALATGDPDRYRIGAEAVRAVDTTGAGDAFNGALLAALPRLDGRPFREAAEYANRSAALSTETIGTATAMPTREQVQGRFDPGPRS